MGRGATAHVHPGLGYIRRNLTRPSCAHFHHFLGGEAASRARFSFRTLTRGSPRTPNWRSSVLAATNWRRVSALMARAAATRGTWASTASGLRCGSSPLPEAVTASPGTAPVNVGFSARKVFTSAVDRKSSFWLVGPRLLPPEDKPS